MSSASAPLALPFASRLRDLLATLESASLLGAAESRVRGLGEHLRFACLALPCSEALVALELETLGRLRVPAIASAEGWRAESLELLPGGTPFAYLLGGGGGHSAELAPGDPMIAPLRPLLAADPVHGIFVPIRIGEGVIGGAALLSHEGPLSDHQLDMAERLGEVLSLTIEAFRTERVLFELFARALPDLLGAGAETDLAGALERHIHGLRLGATYRRRLELAAAVGRIADHGEAETRLAAEVLDQVDSYLRSLESPGEVAP